MNRTSRLLLRLISISMILMMTAVVEAQETPVGRAVTKDDWQDRLPVLGIIMVFTIIVTGTFFYYAIRNMRQSTARN
ncbi:MAG: hypothetical protein RLP44_18265 [Aggregatilineales bacterium]